VADDVTKAAADQPQTSDVRRKRRKRHATLEDVDVEPEPGCSTVAPAAIQRLATTPDLEKLERDRLYDAVHAWFSTSAGPPTRLSLEG